SRCLPDENGNFNPLLGKCPATTVQVALIGPSLDIDYRDNPFMPTRGTFTHFIVDYSHPDLGSSDKVEFVKVDSDFRHYLRLGSPRLVWANSARAGYLANLSGEEGSGVPTSQAFFLGGIYTVRGFDLASDNERI